LQSPRALDSVDLVRRDRGHLGGIVASEIAGNLLNTIDRNNS
jgi:hypothetical protein